MTRPARPTQAQLREARDILERIIEHMPIPQAQRSDAAGAYLAGALAALNLATGTPTPAPKGHPR